MHSRAGPVILLWHTHSQLYVSMTWVLQQRIGEARHFGGHDAFCSDNKASLIYYQHSLCLKYIKMPGTFPKTVWTLGQFVRNKHGMSL